MPSISNSLKKLKQKREDFNLKMNDLMKLDATYTTANSNHDASMSDSSLDNETFTIPKQLYNASSDIVCQAFRSEVLLNSIPPANSSENTASQEEENSSFIHPMYFSPTDDDVTSNAGILQNLLNEEEILALISSIPSLNERCADLDSKYTSLKDNYSTLENKHVLLENKYSELDDKYTNIQNENTLLKNQLESNRSESSKEINKTNQYSRRNSLLGHRLRRVPTNLHGTPFSKYVAAELRRNMPGLSISHRDIDTSHILYYEFDGQNSLPVVVIKFVHRDLRNQILHYENTGNSEIYFTEHLTFDNRKLFERAQEKCSNVLTEQCRIFVTDGFGRRREILTEADLEIPSFPNQPQVSSNDFPVDALSTATDGQCSNSPGTFQNNNYQPHSLHNRKKVLPQAFQRRKTVLSL